MVDKVYMKITSHALQFSFSYFAQEQFACGRNKCDSKRKSEWKMRGYIACPFMMF